MPSPQSHDIPKEVTMNSELTTVRLGGAAQGFNWLPVYVADEQGFFAEAGLNIEYLRLGSVDKTTAAVLDGSVDLAITPPEGAVANYVAGGPLRIVASNSERLPMSVVARPGIPDLAALRGKRIGTSSLTEGTAIYIKIMLAQAGMHYPGDFGFVLAGVHTARWAALQNDEIDAAPQPAPWSFLAEREGYGLIGEVADAIPEIIFAAIVGSAPWLAQNRDVVQRLLAAIARAHAFVNDPANDSVTLPIYQRITTPEAPDLAARGLQYTRDLGMWPVGARVSFGALATTVDVMVQTGLMPDRQRAAAAGVVDASFLEGA
jgi:ABC-type nitrate/sulfonate/bicarbonate transport system substrate-binding protein